LITGPARLTSKGSFYRFPPAHNTVVMALNLFLGTAHTLARQETCSCQDEPKRARSLHTARSMASKPAGLLPPRPPKGLDWALQAFSPPYNKNGGPPQPIAWSDCSEGAGCSTGEVRSGSILKNARDKAPCPPLERSRQRDPQVATQPGLVKASRAFGVELH
jgi:hypothetical protein